MKKFLDGPKTPLIVDRRFDMAFMLLWLIYSAWAFTSGIEAIPSLNAVADSIYQTVWALLLGFSALIAFVFAGLTFIPTPMARVTKEKVEMYSVISLAGLIFVYPCVLLFNLVALMDSTFAPGFVLSLSYLVFTVYRIMHLWSRIKAHV